VVSCEICLQKKAQLSCGLCIKEICKDCSIDLGTYAFSFMSKVPQELTKEHYCLHCYDTTIQPKKTQYETRLKQAEDIYFLTKAYPGYVRVLKKHTKRVVIKECPDRKEAILRMAFFAVELGFNAIIDADLKSHKTRNGGYQSSYWSSSALPADIDGEQLERASLKRI